MKLALCTCEGRVKRKELEKVDNARIFEKACSEKIDEKFDIFGCSHPALKDYARILIDLNNLVFLRQKDSAEKAKLLLKAYYELLSSEPSFIDTGLDQSLLAKTDDFRLVSMLSRHFNPLYVITNNKAMVEIAVAMEGEIRSISGYIGSFRVDIDGIDLRTGKRVKEIEVSQILIPGMNDPREGIFSSESEVIEAIYNRDGILKIKPLNYRREICGVSYNALSGCRLCKCQHDLIKHGERVDVDLISCYGCGLCSSLCPSDALSFEIFPREALFRMIDILSGYRKRKTLLFACKNAIGNVYGGKKTDSFFPIVMPCINALSEVEILYPLVRGFSGVYILPCDCPHGDFEGVQRAMKIAEMFGINSILMVNEFDADRIRMLNSKRQLSEDVCLKSPEKRAQLIEILSYIKKELELREGKIDFDDFGYMSVSETCTLCKTCSSVCFMNAIERNGGRLEFTHGLCVNCNLCMLLCPENSIAIEKGLHIDEMDVKRVLKEERMIKCPRCHREHISVSEYRKISALTGHKIFTLYCNDCKPVIVFEGLYREMAGESNGENK